jgi:hypothetical protein
LAWLVLDRNLRWFSPFREMARVLGTYSGAVCALLACHVDFRRSRLRLAWALLIGEDAIGRRDATHCMNVKTRRPRQSGARPKRIEADDVAVYVGFTDSNFAGAVA